MKKPVSPARLNRRHQLEVLVGVAAYTLVLVLSIELLKQGITGLGRVLLALSPMLPAAFIVWSVFRNITRLDELQRRIQTESLALAAAGTAFLGLTYTFLEGSAGFPRLGAWWAWASVGLIWAIARLVLRRRYL
ncbi:MAG TPA: hypothetical protein VFM15_10480 [Gammaproteobacteria bacterium]|nr:hypothetical protein [Gammaproteobacteria bacterium]